MTYIILTALMAALSAQAANAQDTASAQDIVVVGVAHPIDAPRVPDSVLAQMRGGISLPNGLQVAIGVDIQTRVDNVLVLHTVYASDGPTAGVSVYTDGIDADRIAPGTVVVRNPGQAGIPTVAVTRSPAGTTISPGSVSSPSTVNLVSGDPGTWLNANGQTPIPVQENGPPVIRPEGSFSLASDERGSVVTLDASMLQIRHLVGQATGTAVANTANNRAIETVSSVNIDLQGGTALATLSGLFMADRVAFAAMAAR